jgi:hypothetical protein
VIIDGEQFERVAELCYFLQLLRAWYERVEAMIREMDRAAAVKAHDLFVEGAVAARKLARSLQIPLVDVSAYDWTVQPRPVRSSADF